jgi:hypothetical protein
MLFCGNIILNGIVISVKKSFLKRHFYWFVVCCQTSYFVETSLNDVFWTIIFIIMSYFEQSVFIETSFFQMSFINCHSFELSFFVETSFCRTVVFCQNVVIFRRFSFNPGTDVSLQDLVYLFSLFSNKMLSEPSVTHLIKLLWP